jgi:uncharacterized delta-60 repeat protein
MRYSCIAWFLACLRCFSNETALSPPYERRFTLDIRPGPINKIWYSQAGFVPMHNRCSLHRPLRSAVALVFILLCGCNGATDLFSAIDNLVNPPVFPGDLDASFGSGGVIDGVIGGVSDWISQVSIRSGGTLLAAGTAHNGADYDFALLRFTASGNLDTTFGDHGSKMIQMSSGNDDCSGLVVQPDGRIILAGSSGGYASPCIALARFLPDGALDDDFGTAGKVYATIPGGAMYANSIALLPDGAILTAGETYNGSVYSIGLAKFTKDGDLDTSFGVNGIVSIAVGTDDSSASAMVVQPDGKIIVAGMGNDGTNTCCLLARLESSGQLDSGFGDSGTCLIPSGPSDSWLSAVVLQEDGKILAAGECIVDSFSTGVLLRLTSSGNLDTAFGTEGVVQLASTGGSSANALVMQGDGKIIVAGSIDLSTESAAFLIRYETTGEIDLSFGSEGVATTRIGDSYTSVRSLCIDPGGRIVAAGSSYYTASRFFLARYWQ